MAPFTRGPLLGWINAKPVVGAAIQGGIKRLKTGARRWDQEMEEIGRTFGELGMTPKIFQGAADMYRLVSRTKMAGETAETLDKSRSLEQTVNNIKEIFG